MLVQACRRLGLDGLSSHPAHYHNALVASRWFRFLVPADERRFGEIKSLLGRRDLAEASTELDDGKIRRTDGTIVRWKPGAHVLPVSPRLIAWFDSPAYRKAL